MFRVFLKKEIDSSIHLKKKKLKMNVWLPFVCRDSQTVDIVCQSFDNISTATTQIFLMLLIFCTVALVHMEHYYINLQAKLPILSFVKHPLCSQHNATVTFTLILV